MPRRSPAPSWAECVRAGRSSGRMLLSFFFQAEDGIRDYKVTGVQTCALPIWTGLTGALRQGGELVSAGSELADRVVVVFTDGEAHDTLPDIVAQAERLRALGVRLIVVAEGTRTPTRIPVRDERGALQSWQRDEAGSVIQTWRRDDILGAVADAAQGAIVAAELPDQAGAGRGLGAADQRGPGRG